MAPLQQRARSPLEHQENISRLLLLLSIWQRLFQASEFGAESYRALKLDPELTFPIPVRVCLDNTP